MKLAKALLVILVLGAVITVLPGCKAKSNAATATTQIASVTRGNLTKEISAAGNLALALTEDLAVDLFYPTGTKGTISEVLVQEGDSVTKGQVLVTLDKSEWDDQLANLEDSLIAAQRNVTAKQRSLEMARRAVVTQTRNVAAKEDGVTIAERQITSLTLAVQQAQIDVQTANNTLNKITEVKKIQDRIDNDNFVIKYGKLNISLDFLKWSATVNAAQADLLLAQQEMRNLLTGAIPTSAEVAIQVMQAQLQFNLKQVGLETAQMAADNALSAVDDANTALANARQDLTFAEQDVTNAEIDRNIASQKTSDTQKSLYDAKAASPDIKAPFDGFVTRVNNKGGDEVLNGTVVAQIADPNKFESDILVSEMDIPQVKVGGIATVIADALPTTLLIAAVTHVSPTATISAGVVNYNVKVEVQAAGASPFMQFGQSGNNTTQMPAFGSGNFTRPSGTGTPGAFRFNRGTGSTGTSGLSGSSNSAATAADLRQGLTVTVTIIIANRTDVLMVPNGAVATEGINSYVQVVGADGKLEKRQVTIGISNWQFTEITEGLKESEQVQVALNTAPSTNFQAGGNAIFMRSGR
jgi:multidrug efflux pump subunit AcrA (membrane-fusion protein)